MKALEVVEYQLDRDGVPMFERHKVYIVYLVFVHIGKPVDEEVLSDNRGESGALKFGPEEDVFDAVGPSAKRFVLKAGFFDSLSKGSVVKNYRKIMLTRGRGCHIKVSDPVINVGAIFVEHGPRDGREFG
ncbi:hypothetical protein SARC_03790 [Sphaeroforma arctica JP610]|uniref:Uncharacterized protein n=1 Tax=Sphaeroforma arctica JP610 TaxID=667725 RepID=A0A0L0G4J3_9EUKA|nr:hypothetical protein SARC_03790 [Sphaeroforma arctica JP610]KNC83970.1 hypothetical protein SARC_03790 [Sphaeroforma arctica JP610]|eukprot:XP_014157872.1 hypothetical protein SARC_03790 [Sphaeroforma arctica JP610]